MGGFGAEGSCDPPGMTKGSLWLLCGGSLQGESRVEAGKLVATSFNRLGEELPSWSRAVVVEVVKVFRFRIYFRSRARRGFKKTWV